MSVSWNMLAFLNEVSSLDQISDVFSVIINIGFDSSDLRFLCSCMWSCGPFITWNTWRMEQQKQNLSTMSHFSSQSARELDASSGFTCRRSNPRSNPYDSSLILPDNALSEIRNVWFDTRHQHCEIRQLNYEIHYRKQATRNLYGASVTPTLRSTTQSQILVSKYRDP